MMFKLGTPWLCATTASLSAANNGAGGMIFASHALGWMTKGTMDTSITAVICLDSVAVSVNSFDRLMKARIGQWGGRREAEMEFNYLYQPYNRHSIKLRLLRSSAQTANFEHGPLLMWPLNNKYPGSGSCTTKKKWQPEAAEVQAVKTLSYFDIIDLTFIQ